MLLFAYILIISTRIFKSYNPLEIVILNKLKLILGKDVKPSLDWNPKSIKLIFILLKKRLNPIIYDKVGQTNFYLMLSNLHLLWLKHYILLYAKNL